MNPQKCCDEILSQKCKNFRSTPLGMRKKSLRETEQGDIALVRSEIYHFFCFLQRTNNSSHSFLH